MSLFTLATQLKQLVSTGKVPLKSLEEKILQVNPLIEAFGNAKTGINDNSSRFGKYLDVLFSKSGRVMGATLSVYLLEQSRVVFQSAGERNFHIFYYLYAGLDHEDRLSDYFLHARHECRSHRYLPHFATHNQQQQSTSQPISSNSSLVQAFNRIVSSFQLLGFRSEDTDTVFGILAAILHLGDVDFESVETVHNTNGCQLKNLAVIPVVSQLLRVDGRSLSEALTSNTVVMRGESISRKNTVQEAESARDAMAKALYGRLFDWIVNQINHLLNQGHGNRVDEIQPTDNLTVGLLDIFGFENFKKNSLEQLFINIANEQIQFYFNQHIFKMEQQEYSNEGIPLNAISFNDNRPLLDLLLTRPMGLLSLLDEESHFPNATNSSLIDKFHNNLAPRSPSYIRPKGNNISFTIAHYAGRVSYDANNFLEKNRHFIPTSIIQLHRQSTLPLIRTLFGSPLTKTGNLPHSFSQLDLRTTSDHRSSSTNIFVFNNNSDSSTGNSSQLVSQTKSQQTISTYFRFSLLELLQKLNNSTPHFVRCLKPNDAKQSMTFVPEKVLEQLRFTGIMETIEIRRQGYSHRISFVDFVRRYAFLGFSYDEDVKTDRETSGLLLKRLRMDGFALGKSKVFLRYYHLEFLSREYDRQLRKIIIVQSYVRRWLAKRKVHRERQRRRQLEQQRQQQLIQQQKLLEKERQKQEKLRQKEQNQQKSNWLGRKRVADVKVIVTESRNKSANRQDSPELPNGQSNNRSGYNSSHAAIVVNNHDERENRKKLYPSPTKAAIMIQKCVRGYLTRKKVKGVHCKVTDYPNGGDYNYGHAGNHKGMPVKGDYILSDPMSSSKIPHFSSPRMQLYYQQKQQVQQHQQQNSSHHRDVGGYGISSSITTAGGVVISHSSRHEMTSSPLSVNVSQSPQPPLSVTASCLHEQQR